MVQYPFQFLLKILLFLVFVLIDSAALGCVEHEREALLQFKADVNDPSNRLASWRGHRCCHWAGVTCSNKTGHVIKLHLPNSYFYMDPYRYPDYEWNNHSLSGKINPSLQNITELEHLDLSYNNFSGNHFPTFIVSSFRNLNYLNLSSTGLSGLIPPQLGNLSKLQYLDLSVYIHSDPSIIPVAYVSNVWWLSHLTSLTHLDMFGVNFYDSREWVQALNSLPLLQSLNLGNNNLTTIPTSITELNFSSLQILSIRGNEFNSRIPDWIGKLTTLTTLELWYCSFVGQVPSQLGNLTKLQYLELGVNKFNSRIPDWIGKLTTLTTLELWDCSFVGQVPSQLGNLTKLQLLYLDEMPDIYVSDVWSLSYLTSLKYLFMSNINFQDSREWVQALNSLPLLQSLYLSSNNLTTIPASITGLNFSSLKSLSIRENKFNSRIPDWIGKLTTLTTLQLWDCSFVGQVPSQLGNLTSLSQLYLVDYYLEGPMPPLHNLKNLTRLYISDINIGEDVREVVGKLANDTLYKLEELIIWNASLTGNLTRWVSKMPNLKELNLGYNNLNGTLPTEIRNLTSLESLSLYQNYFTGEVSEAQLTGLSNLKELDLDSNYITITIKMNWVPSFQLNYLWLSGCKLGPHFPSWLQSQSQMTEIDMSNTKIADTVPNWFWNLRSLNTIYLSHNHITGRLPLSLEHLTILDTLVLSDNQFEGGIPTLPRSVEFIDLSNNNFSGQLPTRIEAPDLLYLILSKNLLNGTIEQLTCRLNSLSILNLAENSLSGNLPRCWPSTLEAVNLAHNNLSGAIPSFMGNLNLLWVLQLNNNKLTGELPSTLKFCQNLTVLDLGENNFTGQIPGWIGESLKNLTILRLRSNLFSGAIPVQLVKLQHLQVLDLAHNKISGMIPQSMNLLLSMVSLDSNNNNSAYIDFLRSSQGYYNVSVSIAIKDLYLEYTTSLSLLKSIDLSGNNLTGMIPKNITTLYGLRNLNLSNNYLIGPIPLEIGNMSSIESLDFRINKLSGRIPQSLTNLNFLSILNLSYNNLSGKIPIGYQLQTLDSPYIYIGNEYLCGSPLNKSCDPGNVNNSGDDVRKAGEDLNKILLYLFVVLGFGCGFWVVFGVLFFKVNWRYWFFHIVDNWFDWIYVLMAVYLGKVRK